MHRLSLDSFRKYLFNLYLVSFVISFFFPLQYKNIVQIQFSVLAPLVLLFNFNTNSLTQLFQFAFIIFTCLTIIIGVPGSALGYAISASIGLFVSQNNLSFPSLKYLIEFRLFLSTTIVFIIASCYILYSNYISIFSIEQLASYFGVASINYVPITISAFASIFTIWCAKKQFSEFNLSHKHIFVLRITALTLALCVLSLSIVFDMRTGIIGFFPLIFYAIQPKHLNRFFLIVIAVLVIILYIFPILTELVTFFLAPNRESILDLYDTELIGQERSERAYEILKIGIPKMSFCINCSDSMSYSGLANLVALSFPFSIFYIFKIGQLMKKIIVSFNKTTSQSKLYLIIIIFAFVNSLFLVIFQPDFLSMTSLFYIIGSGLQQVILKHSISDPQLPKLQFSPKPNLQKKLCG